MRELGVCARRAVARRCVSRRAFRPMGPNRRAQERERAPAGAAAEARRVEAERKSVTDTQKIVAFWNARQIRTAAGYSSISLIGPDESIERDGAAILTDVELGTR